MWTIIKTFLGGSSLSTVTEALSEAYTAKLKAQTNEAKLEAELTISQLEARRDLIVSEQKRWLTAWIRPALAAPVVILMFKLIVWDTVLGLGVTPDPGEIIRWYVYTITGAYFLTRPFERK